MRLGRTLKLLLVEPMIFKLELKWVDHLAGGLGKEVRYVRIENLPRPQCCEALRGTDGKVLAHS